MRKFASCTVLTKAFRYAGLLAPDGSTQLSWQIVRTAARDLAARTGANEPLRS
jgi:hypothetical protein